MRGREDSAETAAEAERLQTAGDWLLRLESDELDQHELADWLEWYGADARHRAAFEEMQSRYEMLRTLPGAKRRALADRLMPPVREPWQPVARRPAAPRAGPASRGAGRWWHQRERLIAACIGAFVAFGVSFGLWYASPANRSADMVTAVYRTERGKHEVVDLPDGSQVRIGARSSVSVSFTEDGRYLVLEGGEAFFKVAHEPKRPFVVQAGPVSVRAVGTEFNIRRALERVVVTVSEGEVDVVPQYEDTSAARRARSDDGTAAKKVRATAGERVTLFAADTAPAVTAIDPQAALAWQAGRLEFVDEPLRAVVATINRYSRRELILTDAQLGEMSFTGTVYEGRVDEWLEALQEVFPIRVVNAGAETILLSPIGKRT